MNLVIAIGIAIWAIVTVAAYYWPARSQAGPVLGALVGLSAISMLAVLGGAGWLVVGVVN